MPRKLVSIAANHTHLIIISRQYVALPYNEGIAAADSNELVVWAYIMQGVARSDLVELKEDPTLFEQSFDKYQQAVNIKPDKHEAFNN